MDVTDRSMVREDTIARKRRRIRRAAGVFIALMAGLTLLSNTILTMSLPEVSLLRPVSGYLIHSVNGLGTVQAADIVDHTVSVTWPVKTVLVQEGDRVNEGDVLIIFDTEAVRLQLLDEQARYEQRKLSMRRLEHAYISAQQAGDDEQRMTVEWEIESLKLELQIQERKIAQLVQQIAEGEQMTAKTSGIVMEVRAEAGTIPAVQVMDESKGWQFRTTVPSSQAARLHPGDAVDITIPAMGSEAIQGTVNRVALVDNFSQALPGEDWRSEIIVDIRDDRLRGGEAGELEAVIRSQIYSKLLPKSVVREDERGAYLLVIREQTGPLGTEYYAVRAAVAVGDADESMAYIEDGIGPADLIIDSGEQTVRAGDRVLLANP